MGIKTYNEDGLIMNGLLEIRKVKDNSTENLSYYTLQQLDPTAIKEKLKSIYNPYRHKQLILQCMCNEVPIDMKMGYIEHTDTYYLSSFPNQANKHKAECYFFNDKSLSSNGARNKKSSILDEKGNYQVTLNSHDFKKDKEYKTTAGNTGTGGVASGLTSNKLSTHQLIRMIVSEAWNTYVFYEGKSKYPSIKLIFKQFYNSTLRKFYITKKINLKDVLFHKGKAGRVFYIEKDKGSQSQPFVMFLLKSFKRQEDGNYVVSMTNPVTDDFYFFTANENIMEHANQINRVTSDSYIVGGFVKSTGKGRIPEFISLGILPINKQGVIVESSYEQELYDLLCEQNRLFQRPIDTKYHPKWSGLVPDGLLIDTSPYTIIEVFGMSENHSEYHHHREYKINHYNSLESYYDFWYWDAFKNLSIPPLPPGNK